MDPISVSLVWIVSIAVALAVSIIGTALAGDIALALPLLVLLVSFIGWIALTGFFTIDPDEMIQVFLLGSWRCAYINEAFGQVTESPIAARLGARPPRTMFHCGGRPGLWKLDIVILLYPFYKGVRASTEAMTMHVSVAQTFTKETPTSPSIPVTVDGTLVIRLAPMIAKLAATFPSVKRPGVLYRHCEVKEVKERIKKDDQVQEQIKRQIYTGEHGASEHEPGQLIYDGPIIGLLILRKAENTIIEAVRSMTAYFPWHGKEHGVDIGIKSNQPRLERLILHRLSAWESMFVQGGIIEQRGDLGQDNRLAVPGESALVVDFNVENIDVDPTLRPKLSAPMEGKLEGERLKKIAASVRSDEGKIVYAGEVAKNIKEVKIFSAQQPLLQAVLGWLNR